MCIPQSKHMQFRVTARTKDSENNFMQHPRGCFQGGWYDLELQDASRSGTKASLVVSYFCPTAFCMIKHISQLVTFRKNEHLYTERT